MGDETLGFLMFLSTSYKPNELADDIFRGGCGTGEDMLLVVYSGVHCNVTSASFEPLSPVLKKSYVKTHLWHVL